jgi:hypothetical protein
MKNAVFWDVAQCRSCVNRCFGGTSQPTGHAGFSLADFSTLKMEAIRSSEMSVHTRYTRRHITGDGILHSHLRGNLKSYKTFLEDFYLLGYNGVYYIESQLTFWTNTYSS